MKRTITDEDDEPKLARKIATCQACRRAKRKCTFRADNGTCDNCLKKNIECVMDKNFRTILEDDAKWKSQLEDRLAGIEALISGLKNVESSTESEQPSSRSSVNFGYNWPSFLYYGSYKALITNCDPLDWSNPAIDSTQSDSNSSNVSDYNTMIHSWSKELLQNSLSYRTSSTLFQLYKVQLDPKFYGIADHFDTYTYTLETAPFLAITILTVASLYYKHDDTLFPLCFALLKRISECYVSRPLHMSQSLNDIRALCIGSAWLPDLEFASYFTCNAVRIACDLNLPRYMCCFDGISDPHLLETAVERTKLWYFVYMIDHRLSILNGNHPLSSAYSMDDTTFRLALSSYGFSDYDRSLLAEVALLEIIRKFQIRLEPNNSGTENHPIDVLAESEGELRQWLTFNRLKTDTNKDEVTLHFNQLMATGCFFARAYICSSALKTLRRQNTFSFDLNAGEDGITNGNSNSPAGVARIAVEAIIQILTKIVAMKDWQSPIIFVPNAFAMSLALIVNQLHSVERVYGASLDIPRGYTKRLLSVLAKQWKNMFFLCATRHHGMMPIIQFLEELLQPAANQPAATFDFTEIRNEPLAEDPLEFQQQSFQDMEMTMGDKSEFVGGDFEPLQSNQRTEGEQEDSQNVNGEQGRQPLGVDPLGYLVEPGSNYIMQHQA